MRTGAGLLAALQLADRVEADASLARRAARACPDAGVITRALGGGGLQISPPLVIAEDQIAKLVSGIRARLDAAAWDAS